MNVQEWNVEEFANKSIPKVLFVKKQNVIYNHITKRSTANSDF